MGAARYWHPSMSRPPVPSLSRVRRRRSLSRHPMQLARQAVTVGDVVAGRGKGGLLAVGLAGVQAVVQAAEQAGEEVALRGRVSVSGLAASVGMDAGAG